MILNDNETAYDLLNNQVVAEIIINTISESAPEPITIGVHGDWGAGKSSVLRMIGQGLADRDGVVCLHFNGWLFQGFEDAKIILIETIVHELLKARPTVAKVKEAAKNVFSKLDWLRIAKQAGGLAWTAFTGVPTPGQLNGAMDIIKGLIPSEPKDISSEQVEKAIGEIGAVLQPGKSRHVSQEVQEFRDGLAELLIAAEVDQLVVLIDDLDRCLPGTSIEILEALRLFLLIPGAAFVIAADEVMIEYAVRQHFPDLPASERAKNYTRNYLEKLIHVPFRLSPLGIAETRVYASLLMLMSSLGPEDDRFKALASKGKELLLVPWECEGLCRKDLVGAVEGEDLQTLESCLALGNTIGKILAKGTKGNPRQIKRFLNTLLLRQLVSQSRGLGSKVAPDVMAKLMLAEQFLPNLYNVIVEDVSGSDSGASSSLAALEAVLHADKNEGGASEALAGVDDLIGKFGDDDCREWLSLPPELGAIDLRAYLFVARDKQRIVFDGVGRGDLNSLLEKLLSSRLLAAQARDQIMSLSPPDVQQLCALLRGEIFASGTFREKPKGIDGFKILAGFREEARDELMDLLLQLPPEDVGLWGSTGWQKCLPLEKYRDGLVKFLNQLVSNGPDEFRKGFEVGLKSLKPR